jgi:Bardet-Biedl syndrome 2 protein
MADESHRIKNSVMKAEDARLLNDMPRMRRFYMDLFHVNNTLVAEYSKRANNHDALLLALKDVNSMIQVAAQLRHGQPKAAVIVACRKAIKANNMQALFYIIQSGHEEILMR